jgi:hypothetical protein
VKIIKSRRMGRVWQVARIEDTEVIGKSEMMRTLRREINIKIYLIYHKESYPCAPYLIYYAL